MKMLSVQYNPAYKAGDHNARETVVYQKPKGRVTKQDIQTLLSSGKEVYSITQFDGYSDWQGGELINCKTLYKIT